MTRATEPSRGLSDVSQRELRDILRAIDAGWLGFPCNELSLAHAGLNTLHCRELSRLLEGQSEVGARALIEVALAERIYRPPPRIELVWTGPEAEGSTARDTSIIVQHLFEHAV